MITIIPLELTEEAFNRLHHTINQRRKSSTAVTVSVEDLKALLYDYAKLNGREVRIQ